MSLIIFYSREYALTSESYVFHSREYGLNSESIIFHYREYGLTGESIIFHSMEYAYQTGMDGKITSDFTSFLTVFQSYREDECVIRKGCVQWSPVHS